MTAKENVEAAVAIWLEATHEVCLKREIARVAEENFVTANTAADCAAKDYLSAEKVEALAATEVRKAMRIEQIE